MEQTALLAYVLAALQSLLAVTLPLFDKGPSGAAHFFCTSPLL